MKRYRRIASGLLLTFAIGVGAIELPASAAPVQPAQATAKDHRSGPLSPGHLLACAEHHGLPDPRSLVQEALRTGLVHFSLEELGQAFAGYYLLAGELAYPVFDFWLNCVAPYLPVSTPATRPVTIPATPSSSAPPTTPATPGNPVPTPPFFTLGGGSSG